MWTWGGVAITIAQFYSVESEIMSSSGSNLAWGKLGVYNGDKLWEWSQLETQLNTFSYVKYSQKEFITIFTMILFCLITLPRPDICTWTNTSGLILLERFYWKDTSELNLHSCSPHHQQVFVFPCVPILPLPHPHTLMCSHSYMYHPMGGFQERLIYFCKMWNVKAQMKKTGTAGGDYGTQLFQYHSRSFYHPFLSYLFELM